MSGETEPSGWTPDLLFLHISKVIADQDRLIQTQFGLSDKAIQAALSAAEKAVEKANTANEKRFENVNEFRGQLNDIMTTLISRVEAEARFTAMGEKVDAMQRILDKSTSGSAASKSTTQANWGYLVGLVSLIAMAVTIILAFKP